MGTDSQIVSQNSKIVFFDGVCNLCNGAVTYIIKNDPHAQLSFASLQSAIAEQSLPANLMQESKASSFDSIVLKEGDQLKTKSAAVLTIAKYLRFPLNMLYGFMIIPKPIRDWAYDRVAKNRYRWFGKKDQCMLPTPELKSRFID